MYISDNIVDLYLDSKNNYNHIDGEKIYLSNRSDDFCFRNHNLGWRLIDSSLIYMFESLLKDFNVKSKIDFYGYDNEKDLRIEVKFENSETSPTFYDLSNSNIFTKDQIGETYFKLKRKLMFNCLITPSSINIINLIQFFNCKDIVLLSKEDMFKEQYKNTIINLNRREQEAIDLVDEPSTEIVRLSTYELLGCYVNTSRNGCSLNQENISFRSNNIIFLCPENIIEAMEDFNSLNKIEYTLLSDKLLEMVIVHEFGHLTFDYDTHVKNNNYLLRSMYREKQANYYLSSIFEGTYDDSISLLTSHQPTIYKNPYLYKDFHIDSGYTENPLLYHLYSNEGGNEKWKD